MVGKRKYNKSKSNDLKNTYTLPETEKDVIKVKKGNAQHKYLLNPKQRTSM